MKDKDKKEAEIQLEKGMIAFRQNHYREAVDYFEDASCVLENFGMTYSLAQSYTYLKDHQKAIDTYSKLYKMAGEEIDSNHIIILKLMADEAFALKDTELALKYLDRAMTESKFLNDKSHGKRLYKQICETKEGMISSKKQPESDPTLEMLKQGKAMEERRSYTEAIDLYTKCLNIKESKIALFRKAECYKALRRFEEAIEMYLKCIKLEDKSELNQPVECFYSLQICYMEIGDYEKAIKVYKKAPMDYRNEAKRKKMEKYKQIAQERLKVIIY